MNERKDADASLLHPSSLARDNIITQNNAIMEIKETLTNMLFGAYYFFMVRKEKLKATRLWKDGVSQCEKMYKEIGAPRVYLLFDEKHLVWAPMTYEPNRLLKPSFKILRRMGKMRGTIQNVNSVDDLMRVSYYYTPSKWGALGCKEDNRVREDKLKKWLNYYMLRLSAPMKKARDFQQRQQAQKNRHLVTAV